MMNKETVKTLQDLLVQAAAEYGDKVYMREKCGKEFSDTTFSQLKENCRRVSAFLNECTGGTKTHAAVIGATSAAYLTCYFGTACMGNVSVPLDAQLGVEDLCDHLQRADAGVFFFDKRYVSMLEDIRANCPKIHTYVSMQDVDKNGVFCLSEILSNYQPMQWNKIDSESCAAIVYTSGTTGKSKGVMLSHRNLIDNTMCQDGESSTEDVTMTILPIHHVYCFTCDILLGLRYGTTVCVNDSMMRISQNLKLFQPTTLLLVPMIADTIYKKIKAAAAVKPDVSLAEIGSGVFGERLKRIYSGGAYLNPELLKAYREMGYIICQGYGMTECSPRISTGKDDDTNIGDVGTLVNGCTVRIVDGEIWAKSPSVMMGYYNNKEATAEILTEDGWLRTGDLGYVDEKNRVYITGRRKNLIILSNGENVSPEELENKFSGLDWVGDVLVYAEDDGMITAEVYPNPEYVSSNGKDAVSEVFKAHVLAINKTMPPAKNIRRLRLRTLDFDKTTSRKLKREQTTKGEICE